MKIQLTDSRGHLFANVGNWDDANLVAKSIFKRQYWSDLYYSITFDDGESINGSIDLEPTSFHKPHQNSIFLTHLKTYWGNISRLGSPKFGITESDIEYFKGLLNRLP